MVAGWKSIWIGRTQKRVGNKKQVESGEGMLKGVLELIRPKVTFWLFHLLTGYLWIYCFLSFCSVPPCVKVEVVSSLPWNVSDFSELTNVNTPRTAPELKQVMKDLYFFLFNWRQTLSSPPFWLTRRSPHYPQKLKYRTRGILRVHLFTSLDFRDRVLSVQPAIALPMQKASRTAALSFPPRCELIFFQQPSRLAWPGKQSSWMMERSYQWQKKVCVTQSLGRRPRWSLRMTSVGGARQGETQGLPRG